MKKKCAAPCQEAHAQHKKNNQPHKATTSKSRQENKWNRAAKYRLHADIQRILGQTGCLHRTHASEIKVMHVSGRAKLKGVVTCKGVWFCNLCRARILRQKQMIIKQCHQAALAQKCYAKAVTLILPKDHLESLKPRLNKLKQALLYLFRNGKKNFNLVGRVAIIEVSYSSDHGWNPHVHAILYTSTPLDFDRFASRWEHAVGGNYDEKSTLLVASKSLSFSYLCKGSAPWFLIRSDPDKFKEYVAATKGVRCVQILMSRFKLFRSNKSQDRSIVLAVVDLSTWKAAVVLRGRIYEVLEAAENMDMKKMITIFGIKCIKYWPNQLGPPE